MRRHFRHAGLVGFAAMGLVLPLVGLSNQASALRASSVERTTRSTTANTFTPTAPMNLRRSGATATLLTDGDVLVAGGGTSAAELYHPTSGTWSSTGSMSTVRTDATATLLANGQVLVAGGCCEAGNSYQNLTSAELYNPTTGTWTLTGSLNTGRAGQTATLLPDGDVLVAGGACNGSAYGCNGGSYLYNLRSAELYDPTTGVWTKTGSMAEGREFQTATLLSDGFVLVAGGFQSCDDDFCRDLSSAELYDPVTGAWLKTGSMTVGREQQTATLLADGDVLEAGGFNIGGGNYAKLSSTELYNPVLGTWSLAAPMNHARGGQSATLLPGGRVLVAGGGSETSEVYEPTPGVWVPTGDLSTPRTDQTATSLANGNVLVAGGTGSDQEPLATAEIFHAGVGPLVGLSAGSLSLPTQEVDTTGDSLSFTVTNFGNGPLHVSGVETAGADPSDFDATSGCGPGPVAPGASCSISVKFSPLQPGLRTATVAVSDNAPLDPQAVDVSGYAAGPDVWVPTGSMSTPRADFSSTLLSSGLVLVAGGENYYGHPLSAAELYDPATGAFLPTGSLVTARQYQASVRLPNGSVLVAGGLTFSGDTPTLLSSAEIYNPTTGIWSSTTSMDASSDSLKAILLPTGLVLVTGFDGSAPEVYDPTTATWSVTGPLPVAGFYGMAALLNNGTVLLAGGPDNGAAIYDPNTNAWTATGASSTAHDGGSLTVLPDGDALAVGGFPGNGDNAVATAELYNPTSGTWVTTEPLPAARSQQSAVLLPDGTVLVAGGCGATSCDTGSGAESSYLYEDGFWDQTTSLPVARVDQSAILLPGGDVLLAGGNPEGGADATASAELYISLLVTASPSTAAPGRQISLQGNGFYGREVVVVRLSGAAEKVLARPTATAHGTFVVKVTVPHVPAGEYQITAQGQSSSTYATSSFDVT